MLRKFFTVSPLLALFAAPLAAQQPRFSVDTVRVEVGSRASAALPTLTRGVEVISTEMLRRLPLRTVAEALEWALGVDAMPRSPAQVDVSIRGSSYEQVLVLVDGVRMSDPQSGHFDLNLAVPLEQVERIEVLRGVASALYGSDALGGVVNVVTRRGDVSSVSARAERGSFGTTALAAAAQAVGAGTRLDVGAELHRSRGHRPGTDYQIAQGRVSAEVPLAGRALRADFAHAARDFGADGFYASFPSYEETRTTVASLGWLSRPGRRSGVDARMTYRVHGDDFVLRREDPAFYRNLHISSQLGGEMTGRVEAGHGVRLAGGIDGYLDALESSNLGDRTERRAAVFAEAAVEMRRDILLNAGLRADWHSEYELFLAPSLAVAWWPTSELRLRASLGRAFRAPTWTERFYRDPQNIGTPDLAPEHAWSAEVGAELAPAPGVHLAVTGWARQSDELIDWARPQDSSEPWRTRNVGRARFHGVEAEVAAILLGTRWTAQVAALRFDASDADGFTSKYALRPLTRTLSLAASRPLLPGLEGTARLRHARRAGIDTPDSASECVVGAPGSSSEVGGRLAYSFRQVRTFVDLRNAGDSRACDIVARPAAGRALYVGVEWRG